MLLIKHIVVRVCKLTQTTNLYEVAEEFWIDKPKKVKGKWKFAVKRE